MYKRIFSSGNLSTVPFVFVLSLRQQTILVFGFGKEDFFVNNSAKIDDIRFYDDSTLNSYITQAQLDQMFLPRAHDAVFSALSGGHERPAIESLGIVETHTLAGAVLGLDRALKIADVQVVELRLSAGLGGKGYFVVTGSLHDVEAGVEASIEAIGSEAVYEIIASPHPDFVRGAL